MIFTNVVRTFLRAGIRASNDLLAFAKRYADQDVDVEPVHKHAYTMLESATRQSPITLEFAGKFLDEVDQVMEKILSGTPANIILVLTRMKKTPTKSKSRTNYFANQ